MNQEHAQHVAAFLRWCMQSGTPMPYNLLQAAAQSWDAIVQADQADEPEPEVPDGEDGEQ